MVSYSGMAKEKVVLNIRSILNFKGGNRKNGIFMLLIIIRITNQLLTDIVLLHIKVIGKVIGNPDLEIINLN